MFPKYLVLAKMFGVSSPFFMFMPVSFRLAHACLGLCFLGGMTWAGTAHAQPRAACEIRPVPFREDIRPPDAWELAWEAAWPEASEALQTWRAGQFDEVISAWRGWAPHAAPLQAMAERFSLPPSAAYLAWWATCDHVTRCTRATWDEDAVEAVLQSWKADATPLSAMRQAHAARPRTVPLDEWAKAMRTGMRMMENLELPRIHVVQPGETVYSISRAFGLPPKCLAQRNGVWDDLQPGMALIIPDLL